MRGKRPGIVAIVAALLFLFVACYRFNTLGGALGGFDTDPLRPVSLATQVEAGERLLRDFLDGVQGAPPALTYDLSALAQRTLGDNLRSEAILTVVGVAVAAAVTFVAATYVAPWPVALVAATFSALLSPKLYGYPKVLVLAVACLLLLQPWPSCFATTSSSTVPSGARSCWCWRDRAHGCHALGASPPTACSHSCCWRHRSTGSSVRPGS